MIGGIKKIGEFVRKETVLTVALLLAVISAFIVPPDSVYVDYIDFRTLAILFCLMTVVAGFSQQGMFGIIAKSMINRMGSLRAVTFVLTFMCFFFSMFITNDVSLITFVPMTLTVLGMAGEEVLTRWMVPVITLQTIAANLGSMLTPIGNPQNLYLYGLAGISAGRFVLLMLPYTVASAVLLVLWIIVCMKGRNRQLEIRLSGSDIQVNRKLVGIYSILFVLSLLTVARIVPYWVTFAVVLVVVLICQRRLLLKVDYSLIFTFVGFFVFIGNMGRIEGFRTFVESVLGGHEMITSVLASQVISNVPAAVLLSGFTDKYTDLIVGTNLGGLGTLIASMASLISFKYVARQDKGARGRYLAYFTFANVLFLAVLICIWNIIK